MAGAIWTGLTLGSIYMLVATGYNVVFSATGVFNFAFPQVMVLGTFLAYWATVTQSWPVLVVLVICAVGCALVSGLQELLVIRPMAGKGLHSELVTTVGVSVLIEGLVLRGWGSDPLRVPFAGPRHTFTVGSVAVTTVDLVLVVVAALLGLGAHLWSTRTRSGLACEATTEDREAAILRGIDVGRLSLGAFVATGAMAGVLATVVAPKTFAVATLGISLALKAFVALAIGGFGSHVGALVGAWSLGLVEAVGAHQLGGDYQRITVLVVLLAVLLIRPRGLFGAHAERMV